MKNIVDVIQESNTQPREITNYVESWLKNANDSKTMYALIGAIVQGCHNALDYRSNPEYFDAADKKYNEATDVLKRLVDQMK